MSLLQSDWRSSTDASTLRFILTQVIGGPGQYDSRVSGDDTFYLPLAGDRCQIKLLFSAKEIVKIEPGPAFDAERWQLVVNELDAAGASHVGREYSFSSFRVNGWWTGRESGVQILPPPPEAPVAPEELAEHPFILEFPLRKSESWPITNFRRIQTHRRLTALLNILLAGSTTVQPRRSRHLWATDAHDETQRIRWVQEFYFAKLCGRRPI
jgi:hypothetical protein